MVRFRETERRREMPEQEISRLITRDRGSSQPAGCHEGCALPTNSAKFFLHQQVARPRTFQPGKPFLYIYLL